MSRGILILAAIAGAAARSQPVSEAPQRLVRLNLLATNSKGEAVTDLRAADIQVREDGQLRPTVFFRSAGVQSAMAPEAEGESANHPALPPTVILIDRWNEAIMTTAAAETDVGANLQKIESGQRVFIYFLTNRGDLFPVYPLPANDADLRATAAPASAELHAKLEDAARTLYGFRQGDIRDPVVKANTTFQALHALFAQMGTISGRKNLIWITQGFPVRLLIRRGQDIEFAPQIEAASAAATRSQVAIYTVEESGRGAGASPGSLARDTLQMFASLTGGRSYPSDQTGAALAGASADARGSYRLAYYTPVLENDKKEHKIRVESWRKDVRLLTSEAYFSEFVDPDPGTAERTLLTNLCHSPFDAAEIGLRVKLSPGPEGKSHVAIRIEPADVLFEQHDGKYHGQLDLLYAFYSQDVLKSVSSPIPIDVHLPADQFEKAQSQGINLSQDVLVGRDIGKIRLIVLDRKPYALGSVTVPAVK